MRTFPLSANDQTLSLPVKEFYLPLSCASPLQQRPHHGWKAYYMYFNLPSLKFTLLSNIWSVLAKIFGLVIFMYTSIECLILVMNYFLGYITLSALFCIFEFPYDYYLKFL